MTSIIVDDEPLAREGIQLMAEKIPGLEVKGHFENAFSAADYLLHNPTDLIFLDIDMPGLNGLDFAKSVSGKTLIVFTTAYSQYAVNSYELDAIDYLVKPVHTDRFEKAVQKAFTYHKFLSMEKGAGSIESVGTDFIFVKADRKYFKVMFDDIYYIEGLKDYVVLHLPEQKIITAMNIKAIYQQMPHAIFARVSKSYIVNIRQITSFDNNFINVKNAEIPIGNSYKEAFFEEYVNRSLLIR